jgi:hypothetical protein
MLGEWRRQAVRRHSTLFGQRQKAVDLVVPMLRIRRSHQRRSILSQHLLDRVADERFERLF